MPPGIRRKDQHAREGITQQPLTPVKQKLPRSIACRRIPRPRLLHCRRALPCIVFDKSFIWFEETIYRRLLQILSFFELVLLIIRPFVASGMFVSPILVKAVSSFSFHRSLWHRRVARSQQRENIVAWSGRDEIACQNKGGMQVDRLSQ